MTKVSELVSANVGSAIINSQTWGGILFNVKSYGAKGDGIQDDTTKIQAAIDAAYSGNSNMGIVRIPPGKYLISSTLNLPQGVMIEGYGATLKAKDTTLNPVLRIYNKNAPAAPFNNLFYVFGLNIEGDTLALRSVQMGVSVDTNYQGAGLSTFRDCEIKYFLTGVKLNNGNRLIVFDNCRITAKNFGIQIVSTAGAFTGDHWIKACQFEVETGTCIDMVVNNLNSVLAGIHINGGCVLYCLTGISAVADASGAQWNDIFISETAFDGRGTNSAIFMTSGTTGGSGTVQINNIWLNAFDTGVQTSNVYGVLITTSKFTSLNLQAVNFSNANYCSVENSQMHDVNKLNNGGGAINLTGTSLKTKVRGNAIWNTTGGLTAIPIVIGASTNRCTVTDNSTDTTNPFINNGTATVFANNVGS